jgi:hypothetical protein
MITAMLSGVWTEFTSSVWAMITGILFVAMLGIRVVHAVVYPSGRRDPIRRFARQDKAEILRRAGGRCEHHAALLGRCAETTGLEADHVIPWSRSGPTIIGNGQALCRRHNRAKRATIPFRWQLTALAKRRATYYPSGVSGAVIRRRVS